MQTKIIRFFVSMDEWKVFSLGLCRKSLMVWFTNDATIDCGVIYFHSDDESSMNTHISAFIVTVNPSIRAIAAVTAATSTTTTTTTTTVAAAAAAA